MKGRKPDRDPESSTLDPLELTLQRAGRGGTFLTAAGTLIFVASVGLSFMRLRSVENDVQKNRIVIEQQSETLRQQREEIERNEQRLRTLAPAALRGFGWEDTVRFESQKVQASLVAHDSLTQITKSNPRIAQGQGVVYFAKSAQIDANQGNFIASLRDLGFSVTVRPPINPNRPTNAVWFGNEVDPAAVEMAAYALLRAGYALQHIGRVSEPDGSKARVIEIGASPLARDQPVITNEMLPATLRRLGLLTSQPQ